MRTSLAICLSILMITAIACGEDEATSGPVALSEPLDEEVAAAESAARLCHAYAACDCESVNSVEIDGCDETLEAAWGRAAEDARERALTFDGDCLTRRLNALRERDCTTISFATQTTDCAQEQCLIYHGETEENQSCTGTLLVSDCGQGLVCRGGRCQVPCGPADDCSFSGVCPQGQACDFSVDNGTCVDAPTEGQPCVNGICAAGQWCDYQVSPARCAAPRDAGATCPWQGACASMICNDGRCGAIPGVDEYCQGICDDASLVCAFFEEPRQWLCVRAPGDGEPCLESTINRCQEGLGCLGDVCASPAAEGEPCGAAGSPELVGCVAGQVCGVRPCEAFPNAPGCDLCGTPEGSCLARICEPEPPAVCIDTGVSL